MYPGVKNVILIKSNKNTVVVIKHYYTSHEKKVIYARDNIPKHSVLNLLTCSCERRLAILKLISYHLKNTWGSVTGEQHGILAKGKMGRRDRKGETFSSLPSCPACISHTSRNTREWLSAWSLHVTSVIFLERNITGSHSACKILSFKYY